MANPKVPHFSRLVNNGVVTQYCTIKWNDTDRSRYTEDNTGHLANSDHPVS